MATTPYKSHVLMMFMSFSRSVYLRLPEVVMLILPKCSSNLRVERCADNMARILWKQHRTNHMFMSFSRSIYLRL
eukprot:3743370-Amphidinium_carterae.1